MSSSLPKVSSLSKRVIRILGCNPGPMTLQGTNTYLIGTGKRRILLDTGENGNSMYINLLKNFLESEGCMLQQIIISHWHLDHTGGILDIMQEIKPDCSISKLQRKVKDDSLSEKDYNYLNDGDILTTEGATLKVVATPGHTDDHLVLLLEEEKSLFSGDCILGEGTAVFEDLHTYMQSLEKLLLLKPSVIYPGHGPVVEDPVKKIQEYIQHRMLREQQIIEQLKKASPSGLTVEELVKLIYANVPVHLHPAAGLNVSHHISKLLKEGKIGELREDESTDQSIKYVLK